MRDTNRVQGEFKPKVTERSITFLMIVIVLVISALGGFRVLVLAQWDCDNLPPNAPVWVQAYCVVFGKPGHLAPGGGTKEPFNELLCWGIYGHSGVVDFDQGGVDQYEKELYMEAGDRWIVHGHHWEGVTGVCPWRPSPGARIEIWDPHGQRILDECLDSNQYRWGQVSVTGNYKIKFTPQAFLGYQGKWSLYWQVEFGTRPFCGGGGCGPGGKYPCPQGVPGLVLTARAEGNKVTLEWQSTTDFDLYEIDGAPGTAFGGPTAGFVPLAMLEPLERTYQLGPLDEGQYHFLIWGHRKEGLPVMSNVVTVAITTSKLVVKANCDNARIKVTPPGITVTGPKFGSFTYPQGATVELEALDRQLNSCGMLQVQSVFKYWEVQLGMSKTTFTTPKIQIALNQDTTATAIYESAQQIIITISKACKDALEVVQDKLPPGRCWNWYMTHTYDLGQRYELITVTGATIAGPSEQKGKKFTWQLRLSEDGQKWFTDPKWVIEAEVGQKRSFSVDLATQGKGRIARYVQIFAGPGIGKDQACVSKNGCVDWSEIQVSARR